MVWCFVFGGRYIRLPLEPLRTLLSEKVAVFGMLQDEKHRCVDRLPLAEILKDAESGCGGRIGCDVRSNFIHLKIAPDGGMA